MSPGARLKMVSLRSQRTYSATTGSEAGRVRQAAAAAAAASKLAHQAHGHAIGALNSSCSGPLHALERPYARRNRSAANLNEASNTTNTTTTTTTCATTCGTATTASSCSLFTGTTTSRSSFSELCALQHDGDGDGDGEQLCDGYERRRDSQQRELELLELAERQQQVSSTDEDNTTMMAASGAPPAGYCNGLSLAPADTGQMCQPGEGPGAKPAPPKVGGRSLPLA